MTVTYTPVLWLLPAAGMGGAPRERTRHASFAPLGGSDDDVAALFPAFEKVEPASFSPPSPDDLGNDRAARLLRSALRMDSALGAAHSAPWPVSPCSLAPTSSSRCLWRFARPRCAC